MRFKCPILCCLLLFLFSACSNLHNDAPLQQAAAHGFQRIDIQTGEFPLLSLQHLQEPTGLIRIYIEGDGQAWKTRRIPSDDPTPNEPLALELALADAAPNVVYLARPCQYIKSAACQPEIWTNAKYSDSVINSMVAAVKQIAGDHPIELVGYSGGGTIALLVAAQLPQVTSIRTVAGNLDPAAHVALHGLAPLTGSHNPNEFAERLSKIPQLHFVGAEDDNVPVTIAESYQQQLGNTHCSKIIDVMSATHSTSWVEYWAALLKQSPACHPGPVPGSGV